MKNGTCSVLVKLVDLLCFGLLPALFLASAPSSADVRCRNCNVILISVDTLGASHLGIYGSKARTSPHIDKFFQNASVYRQAYAPAPWTVPSHVAMLTGLYPWGVFVFDAGDRLPEKIPTLAATLKKSGYATAGFVNGYYVGKLYGFNRGFDEFAESAIIKDARLNVDRSLAWLKKNHQKRFFLFVHLYEVHEPFTPSESSVQSIETPKNSKGPKEISMETLVNLATGKKSATREQKEWIRALYHAGIRDTDQELGRLFETINSLGLDKNTVVVLTSDHGEEFGEHGTWGMHAITLYDEVLRVPLLVKVPGKPGRELDSPVSLVDIPPSLLSYLDIPSPPTHGKVLPEIDSPASASRAIFAQSSLKKEVMLKTLEDLVNEVDEARFLNRIRTTDSRQALVLSLSMIRKGDYKLLLDYNDSSFKLFNVKDDPLETKNLISKKPSIACDLKSHLLLGK